MNISSLRDALEREKDGDPAVMVRLGSELMYADIFVRTHGCLPGIQASFESPSSGSKRCSALIREVERFRDSDSYQNRPQEVDDFLLIRISEHSDGSYDLLHFSLTGVSREEVGLVLTSDDEELLGLRESYPAFDDDMLEDE